jgi:ribosomal protein S18 acetylase RimI-like enzyme
MMIKIHDPDQPLDHNGREEVSSFLFNHLDQFGDRKEDIRKAIDYCFRDGSSLKVEKPYGGFVVTGWTNGQMTGAVVVNQTGMDGYIPENILVYIATHREQRGKGLGRKLMETALGHARGNVALHVEPENPARHLYQKLGFTSKYLEMRYGKA